MFNLAKLIVQLETKKYSPAAIKKNWFNSTNGNNLNKL